MGGIHDGMWREERNQLLLHGAMAFVIPILRSGKQYFQVLQRKAGRTCLRRILDTYAQVALEKAIEVYKGAVLMVSHDFYSIANSVDYVLYVEEKTIRRMRIRSFRKMIYEKHFDKDYLELEQKKKELEKKRKQKLKDEKRAAEKKKKAMKAKKDDEDLKQKMEEQK